jgi:HlyD family secretion protein
MNSELAHALPLARRRWPWLVAAILAAGVAATAAWWYLRGEAAPVFRTAKVERGAITAVVSSSGTLNAVTTVLVGSQVSGQIKDLYVDFNTQVKKGQLLARIDPETFELKVRQAEADLDAARTSLLARRGDVAAAQSQILRAKLTADDGKREADRKKMLVAKGFISAAELDKAVFVEQGAAEAVRTTEAQLRTAEAQVANAEATVKQREAALATARVDLARTSIVAPVDGVVISRQIDAGQTVAASFNTPQLFSIAQDLSQMQVDVSIDESDISRIRVGQRVTYTVDAFPGRTFNGTVKQIRKAAVTVQNVVTYTVVVATDNPNLALVPGMTANVRIVTDTRESVLKVPNAALRYRPPGVAAVKDAAMATPTGGGGPGGGSPVDAQARRKRLVDDLKLDAAQQVRLDEIFAELDARMAALREVPEGDRRSRFEGARSEVRQKIRAMLTPDQQKKYTEIVAAETGRGSSTSGRVFVQDGNRPREVALRLGLTDGNSTEVASGDLAEGAEVIVGNVERGAAAPKAPAGAPRLPF